MKFLGVFVAILLQVSYIENRVLTIQYETQEPVVDQNTESTQDGGTIERIGQKRLSLKSFKELQDKEHQIDFDNENTEERMKSPCAIIVLSNMQNPNIQTLLRKYRYDSNGILIPNSVKYFMRLPQGHKSSPLLVQLNDKAFTPLGGFVRYYKEVPPIPQAW